MLYRVIADLVVIVHLSFIVFVVLGGLLALRWRGAPWLHLPTALWGAAIEFFGGSCPLTPLESWLRRASGAGGYPGGFIEYYVLPILYPVELTREIQLVLGAFVIAINLAVYTLVWWSRPRRESG